MPGHVVTKPAELLHHLSVLTVSAIDASVVELSDLTVDEVKDREQHVDRLLGLRRLWRKSGKQLRFEAVEDADGHPHSDPQAAACLLAAHWGPIFAPPVEVPPMEMLSRLLDFIQQVPQSMRFQWFAGLGDVEELLLHLKASAPGPDGVPYGAWAALGFFGVQLLYEAYLALVNGRPPPDGFIRRSAIGRDAAK